MLISVALAASGTEEHSQSLLAQPEFWLAIAFVIFVAVMAKPLGGKIAAALDSRANAIARELEEAGKLRDEAQALLASYQRKSRDALKEAEQILANAEAEARRIREDAAAQLEGALKRREQLAMDKIAQAEARAVEDVRNAAVDVALAATRELIEKNLDADQSKALVEGAIKDLPKRLH
jgi:F-type H+-transporting ATPase subunit b